MRGPPRRLRRAENTPVVQSDRQGVIAAIVRRRAKGGGEGGNADENLRRDQGVLYTPLQETVKIRFSAVQS
ncbi:hypothetical protein ALC62_13193 [Cyphomyrmex costatus]|uniref:Uncharacterized protein n=1 Tax=Cyphomyrmex costatus TaxID=456900 RepID=A0A195C5M0_9HYME|nr:hypothetical protein ALC62_13193 [Cyphomyrmex costatus]